MAPTVLKGLEHHALFLLLIQLGTLLAVARILGEVMKKLHQPPVVGELLAGVLLGPSTFGLAFPGLQATIFPAVQSQADLLSVVAWLGVLFLLVVTGLETDVNLIVQKGGTALMISLGGIVIPFATGLALGELLPAPFLTSPDRRLLFALFMAVAMSISAVPVIAKVLFDLKLIRRDIGQLTLAAAMTDDTIGWILLSVVAGLAARGTVDVTSVVISVGSAIAFLSIGLTIGGRLISGIMTLVDKAGTGVVGQFSLILVLAFGFAAFTQEMGIEAVLGAFVVGILAGQAKRLRAEVGHTLEIVTAGFVAPIFFAAAGLKVDLVRLLDPEVLAVGGIVLAIACMGKFAGCYLGAWIGGLSHWERLAIGSGMNARGAMEIIVATVGLGLGVLTPEMYSVIVMVAIVTSLMAPPLLRWTLSHVQMSADEANRLEREAIAATSFARSIRRVLVVARDAERAELLSDLLAHLRSVQPVELTAIYANLDQEPVAWWQLFGRGDSRRSLRQALGGVRRAVQKHDARGVEVKVATGEDAADKVLREAVQGYDLIAMAVGSEERSDGLLFGRVIDRVVRDAPCATLVLKAPRNGADEHPLRKILVPTAGTEHSRRAVEAASLLAQGAKAELTILHVITGGTEDLLLDNTGTFERARELAEDLVEQHADVARKLGAEAAGRIIESVSPETAIIELAQRESFDLVILGASSRSVQQRAYLGRRAEALLRSSHCTVAVVCTG